MKELDEASRSEIREVKELYFEERYDVEKHIKLLRIVDNQWCDTVKKLIHYSEIDKIFSSEKEKQKELIEKYLQDIFGEDAELKSFEDDKLSRSISFTLKKDIYNLCIPVIQNLTLENFHNCGEGMMRLSKLGIDGSLEHVATSYIEKEFLSYLGEYSEEEEDFEETIC